MKAVELTAGCSVQSKDKVMRHQEREWRSQLNSIKADSATMKSHLKSKDAALAQATADLNSLHKEAGQLKSLQDEKQWEVENLQQSLAALTKERDAAIGDAKRLRKEGGLSDRRISGLAIQAQAWASPLEANLLSLLHSCYGIALYATTPGHRVSIWLIAYHLISKNSQSQYQSYSLLLAWCFKGLSWTGMQSFHFPKLVCAPRPLSLGIYL